MTANVEGMVRAGADALKAGHKDEARALLEKALEFDEHNEEAWLWMSAVVDDPAEQQTCLENVLIINPDNERAQQGLRSLGLDPATLVAADTDSESTPAFIDDTIDAYSVPTSSASVQHDVEISSEHYDNWMENLDLGKGTDDATTETSAKVSEAEDMFGDVDFSADASFEWEFGADTVFDNAGASFDDIDAIDAFFDDAPKPDDDPFDDFDSRSDYANLELDAMNEAAFADFGEQVPAVSSPGSAAASFDSDDADEPAPAPDASAYFAAIPGEIAVTRLPGMDEKTPIAAYAILGILGVLNVIALLFIIMQVAL